MFFSIWVILIIVIGFIFNWFLFNLTRRKELTRVRKYGKVPDLKLRLDWNRNYAETG